MKIICQVNKIRLSLILTVLLISLSVLEGLYPVKDGCKKQEYIGTGGSLVIGMLGSLRGHEILLAELNRTKKHFYSGHEEEGYV